MSFCKKQTFEKQKLSLNAGKEIGIKMALNKIALNKMGLNECIFKFKIDNN